MTDVLRFVSRPRVEETKRSYSIVRCNRDCKFKLSFYVLSTDVFGLEIHYAGKSVVCTQHTGHCRWCDLGRSARWVGYLPATDHERQKLFIAEVTPGVIPQIDAYVNQFGSLRGSQFRLSRPSMKDNGRLDLMIVQAGAVINPGDLPPPFDCQDALARIYGIDDAREEISASTRAVLEPKDTTVKPACVQHTTQVSEHFFDRLTAHHTARASIPKINGKHPTVQ